MLEKLTTHDIQDVSTLISLADKCARATEGRAWHSPATQAAKGESIASNARAQAPCGGNGNGGNKKKKKKKKKAGGNQPLAGAPTAAAAAAGGGHGGKCPRQPSNSDDSSTKCPVHSSTRHTATECWEIKKLMEQFREKMQQRQDGAPSCQRECQCNVLMKDAEMEF
jgi:hypothetical protein